MPREGKWMNDFEHAYKRPDAYIGSIVTSMKERWVYDEDKKRIMMKEVRTNPGLNTIIREIVSNAIDNKWESDKSGIKATTIDFKVERDSGYIEIANDGAWIPVKKQKFKYNDPISKTTIVSNMYPAELYFGYMKAGTNLKNKDEDAEKQRP